MDIEQLKTMSDAELNKLAAIKFLWGGVVNEPSDDWMPTKNMNNAMVLLSEFRDVCIKKNHSGGWIVSIGRFDEFDKELPKAITIASILAKQALKPTP